MERQPADKKCKNHCKNNFPRSPPPVPLQAPCTNSDGHIRDKYYQEWDKEADHKAENHESLFWEGSCVTAENHPVELLNITECGIGDAADRSCNPDDTTYDLGLANSALILCPHHHPDGQTTIQTYGCQKKDAGKHVDNTHKSVELAHYSPKLPHVVLRKTDDRENQKDCEEEVSQGQVEKPN